MKQTEICGVFYSTCNYELFKKLDGNRYLNQANFQKLCNSMKEEQLLIPIIVNEKYEIIDGQHRFEASKKLKLPVFYIVINGYGMEQVKRANIVSANWKKEDFLKMFVSQGKEAYEVFQIITKLHKIPPGKLLDIIAKITGEPEAKVSFDFEHGDLCMDKKEEILEFLEALEDFAFFKEYKSERFIKAFLKLYLREEYEGENMKVKIKTYAHELKKCNSVDEYLEILCGAMYSRNKRKGIKIYYSAKDKKFYLE